MALWKDSTAKEPDVVGRDIPPPAREPAPAREAFTRQQDKPDLTSSPDTARRARPEPREPTKESLIAAGLTIEGKIQGSGHVRIAGNFNGDVQVEGNLTVEAGARLTGQVRANTVVIGGELEGNIDAVSRVELLETGMLSGDVKAASLIVAAGSRMRGRVEFGWDGKAGDKPVKSREGGTVT